MPRRRRRLLAFSALVAVVAAIGAAPLVVAPAFADGVLNITSPTTGDDVVWDSAPNGFHVTGSTTDTLTDVDIYEGTTLLGSCTPDGLGDFDCGIASPYPGPHTLSAEQGGVPHDSVTVDLLYPAMNVPLPGLTRTPPSAVPPASRAR